MECLRLSSKLGNEAEHPGRWNRDRCSLEHPGQCRLSFLSWDGIWTPWQDVFKLAAPANCRYPEAVHILGAVPRLVSDWAGGKEFPQHLAHNYITRARYDAGQFSEPIMYRNLFMVIALVI